MRRPQAESSVTLSVLDRLIDKAPRDSSEAMMTAAQSVREHKKALRRDLEWLLNTRRIAEEPGASLPEVNRSVHIYGLPDFTALSLANPKDQGKLLRTLQTVLKIFEPRLTNVHVATLESSGINTRTLRFRIEGMLQMDPAPEYVSFDTVLELTRGQYEVKGEANAG